MTTQSPTPEPEKVRAALEMALRQNEHDMVMTGEECRQCREALALLAPETQGAVAWLHWHDRCDPPKWVDFERDEGASNTPLYTHTPPAEVPDAEGFAALVEKARAEMERYWLGQSSKHQLTTAIEHAYAAAQPGEGWKQYAKDGESAQDLIERERADSAAFVKLYLDRTSEKSKVVDEMRHPRVQFLPKNLLLEEITRWANALTAAAPPAKREGDA